LALLVAGVVLAGQVLAEQPRQQSEFLDAIASGKKVMWIGAHPDDELITAPLLARAAESTKVIVVSLTNGNAGENKLGGPENCAAMGEIRAKELAASCKVLGVELQVFGFLDVRYSESNEAVVARWKQSGKDPEAVLVNVIRTWKPDIIITFDPERALGHTEHRAAGFLATAAYRDAADPHKFPDQLSATVSAWQAARLYYSCFRTRLAEEKRPDELIPVSDRSPKQGKTYAEIAAEARAQHRTQFVPVQPAPALRDGRPAGQTALVLAQKR
jgi:LmbE family N-acetylglucosaminyl deacetylase